MSKRPLGFESLESRRVCAGNVTVQMVQHELRITGDNLANSISVQEQVIGTTGKYVVRGARFNGQYTSAGDPVVSGPVTTINGSTGVLRISSDNVKLFIVTGDGNDAIRIGGDAGGVTTMTVPRLKVEAGLGDDYLKVDHVKIEGTATELSYLQMTQALGSTAPGQAEAGKDNLIVNSLNVANTDLVMSLGGDDDQTALLGLVTSGADTEILYYGGGGDDYGSSGGSSGGGGYGGGGRSSGGGGGGSAPRRDDMDDEIPF